LSHVVGLQQQKQAAALVLLGPSVPLLFMGEEWGARSQYTYFVDHSEPELANAVRAGRIREFHEFGWPSCETPDPSAAATFQSSRLRWDEIAGREHRELLDWYRALTRLRAESLTASHWPTEDRAVRFDDSAGWFALRVKNVSVLLNFGPNALTLEMATLDLGAEKSPAGARRTLASGENIRFLADTVSLPSAATLVWQC
jgi:maltooligosyltrehalose trehalohydrolase